MENYFTGIMLAHQRAKLKQYMYMLGFVFFIRQHLQIQIALHRCCWCDSGASPVPQESRVYYVNNEYVLAHAFTNNKVFLFSQKYIQYFTTLVSIIKSYAQWANNTFLAELQIHMLIIVVTFVRHSLSVRHEHKSKQLELSLSHFACRPVRWIPPDIVFIL